MRHRKPPNMLQGLADELSDFLTLKPVIPTVTRDNGMFHVKQLMGTMDRNIWSLEHPDVQDRE